MYEINLSYFKELSMYILAGKKRLAEVRATELAQASAKAKASDLPEDAQAAKDVYKRQESMYPLGSKGILPCRRTRWFGKKQYRRIRSRTATQVLSFHW